MSKRDIKKCVLEIIDYLGSRNGFDNWWLQVEDNEESEITKKLEDIIERRLNQNKPLPPPPPKDREIHISGKSRHKR